MENVFGIVYDVRGNAGKGDGQVVEINGVAVVEGQPGKQLRKILPLYQTSLTCTSVFAKPDVTAQHISIFFFPFVQVEVSHVNLVRQHERPVLQPDDRVHAMCIVAYAVQSTDDASHRCSRDNVHWDASFFNHFQRSNVRHAFGSSATQHHSHLLSGVVGLGLCYQTEEEQHTEN